MTFKKKMVMELILPHNTVNNTVFITCARILTVGAI